MNTIIITSAGKPGRRTHTISGLTDGDLRLIASAVSHGSYTGGDQGGPVSKALIRLEHALRVPTVFETRRLALAGNGHTADELYEELENLT